MKKLFLSMFFFAGMVCSFGYLCSVPVASAQTPLDYPFSNEEEFPDDYVYAPYVNPYPPLGSPYYYPYQNPYYPYAPYVRPFYYPSQPFYYPSQPLPYYHRGGEEFREHELGRGEERAEHGHVERGEGHGMEHER